MDISLLKGRTRLSNSVIELIVVKIFSKNGKIIDYSQMTPEQRSGFEGYITSLDKINSETYGANQKTLPYVGGQLNDAADERREAQERVNSYSGAWEEPKVK